MCVYVIKKRMKVKNKRRFWVIKIIFFFCFLFKIVLVKRERIIIGICLYVVIILRSSVEFVSFKVSYCIVMFCI